MKHLACSFLLILPTLFGATAHGENTKPFDLKDGQTIVFLGDSITHGGHYVDCIDIFLTTRYPGKQFRIINRGLSSETVAGTSEADHPGGPRPDLHTRFKRTVTPLKPDVVIACYGMNDGIYRSFNEEVFAKYRAGVARLIERVRDEANAEIILCTPPPFDRRPTDGRVKADDDPGYRAPARDYDNTLAEFGKWLQTKREDGITVIDLHTPLNATLNARRETDPDYLLARDGIHQGQTGHMLMAAEILEGLHASPVVADFTLDAMDATTELPNAYATTLISKLPMPQLEAWDMETLGLAHVFDRLNRYTLIVKGLPAGKYRLIANGEPFATLTAGELAEGVDLNQYSEFPTVARARQVAKRVLQARDIRKSLWIKDDPHPRLAGTRRSLQNSKLKESDAEGLEQEARQLAQPMAVRLRLERLE